MKSAARRAWGFLPPQSAFSPPSGRSQGDEGSRCRIDNHLARFGSGRPGRLLGGMIGRRPGDQPRRLRRSSKPLDRPDSARCPGPTLQVAPPARGVGRGDADGVVRHGRPNLFDPTVQTYQHTTTSSHFFVESCNSLRPGLHLRDGGRHPEPPGPARRHPRRGFIKGPPRRRAR
jgi:hypothetical protein